MNHGKERLELHAAEAKGKATSKQGPRGVKRRKTQSPSLGPGFQQHGSQLDGFRKAPSTAWATSLPAASPQLLNLRGRLASERVLFGGMVFIDNLGCEQFGFF